MASKRRYERVRWAWCSVHLGITQEGSYEVCNMGWNSDLPCRFWSLYANRGTELFDGADDRV